LRHNVIVGRTRQRPAPASPIDRLSSTKGADTLSEPIKVAAFCGSLRKGSYNRMALNAAMALAPTGMTLGEVAIGEPPLHNADLHQSGFPAAAQRAIDSVAVADALLFVTPEYNYSIPAPLRGLLAALAGWTRKLKAA
jgi:hypothetical protein